LPPNSSLPNDIGPQVDNSFAVILPSDDATTTATGLSQLLALVKRSDTVAIKSEGTRVIVNLIKSLWSSDPTIEQRNAEENQTRQQKRERAIQALVTTPCVDALAALVGRSTKYPILINEAIIALSLLSTHRDGGKIIRSMCTIIVLTHVRPVGLARPYRTPPK